MVNWLRALNIDRYASTMKKCFCFISALEILRSSGRLAPEILEKPRTGKVDGCGVPPGAMLADDLARYGITSAPCHLLCEQKSGHAPRGVSRHTHRSPLPSRALIALDRETLVASPELLFLELAASREFDDIEVLQIGYELCGTYVLDAGISSWDGFTNTDAPLTSAAKIKRFLERCTGLNGVKRARKLIEYVADGAHSPMETITALIVSLPHRFGGMGLGDIALNRCIKVSDGLRWVDILIKGSSVGLEYKGRKAHTVEQAARDDRRQNRLTGSGVTTFNIWYEDLVEDHLFERLEADILNALGRRRYASSRAFALRQKLLRARLLPALIRYEQCGG